MTQLASKPIRYYEYHNQTWQEHHSHIIREMPVSLTVNSEIWLTFMCSPTNLADLAVGFLYNERLINDAAEIANVRVCPANDNVDVWTDSNIAQPVNWRRTSGCTGGLTSVDHPEPDTDFVLHSPKPEINLDGWRLRPEVLSALIDEMFSTQDLYRQAGGVHTSMITDADGQMVSAEDIGRHNTLDKLAGKLLREKNILQRRIILTTGRISSDMLQKSARLKAAFVISRTSPTSLSIQLAEAWGITLVGYARRNQFRVYTHPENLENLNK